MFGRFVALAALLLVATPSQALAAMPGTIQSGIAQLASSVASAPSKIDLAVTIEGTEPANAGGEVVWTILVANDGNATATNVSATLSLPAGSEYLRDEGTDWYCVPDPDQVTCTYAQPLARDDLSAALQITTSVPGDVTALTATVNVSATENDPVTGNNTAYDTVTVIPRADLSISLATTSASVIAGGTLTYEITATNAGPSPATELEVEFFLPDDTSDPTFDGGLDQWLCTESSGTATCTLDSLAANGASTFFITVAVTGTGTNGELEALAGIEGREEDPDNTFNTVDLKTPVEPGADLRVLIDASNTALAGAPFSWKVQVLNAGPSEATGLTATLQVPPGATIGSVDEQGWSCNHSGETATCTLASLAADHRSEFTVNGLAPVTPGPAVASAEVSSGVADPRPNNNLDSANTAVAPAADLRIGVTASPEPVMAGKVVTYTIVVNNDGPSEATSVRVTAALPPGVTYVSGTNDEWFCTVGGLDVQCVAENDLAANDGRTLQLGLRAPDAHTDYNLEFTVRSAVDDADQSDNTASVTTSVRSADLALFMGSVDESYVGDELNYSLTVQNKGPSPAQVTIDATLPAEATYVSAGGIDWECTHNAGALSCRYLPALAAGDARSVEVVLTAPSTPSVLTLTGTASSPVADPDGQNNSETVTTTILPAANLKLTASASPAVVAAGEGVTFALELTNAGISPATDVTITGALPQGVSLVSYAGAGWSCATASGEVQCELTNPLVAGSSVPLTLVLSAPHADGPFTVDFVAAAAEHDPDTSDNVASPGVTVTSTDLELVIVAAQDPVLAGGNATFDLTVTNGGPSAATGVTVSLPVPASTSFGTGIGEDWHCSVASGVVTCEHLGTLASGVTSDVSVSFNAPNEPATLSVTASVTGDQIDPNPSNDTDSASLSVAAAADLKVAVTAPAQVPAAGTAPITAEVTNLGPSTAHSVRVTLPLPTGATFDTHAGAGWSCNEVSGSVNCLLAGGLASGATSNVVIGLVAPNDGGTLIATATVSSIAADTNDENDNDTAEIAVVPVADLGATIVATPDPVAAGTDVTLVVTTTNHGPSTANNVRITAQIPADAQYDGGGGGGWTCALDPSLLLTCDLMGPLAAGASSDVSFTLTAPIQTGTMTLTVFTHADENVPTNDSATVEVIVAPAADLGIAISAVEPTVRARALAELEITVTNDGPNDASSVEVSASLPADTEYVSASGPGWTCDESAGELSCELAGTLSSTTSATLTVSLRAPAQPGTFEFEARVDSAEVDLDDSNDEASVPVAVTAVSDLSVALAGAPAVVGRGEVVTFTAEVSNAGPSDAESIELTVALNAGLTIHELRGADWSCTSNPVVCTLPALSAGATATLQVDAIAPSSTGPVNAQAQVSSPAYDPVTDNDSEQAVVQVGAPLLDNTQTVLRVSPTGPATEGATLTYEVSVTNSGNYAATEVEAAIAVPAGTRLTAGSTYQQPFVLGEIGPGETKSASFSVEIELDHPEQIQATAIISATDLLPFERKVVTPVAPDQPLDLTVVATPDVLEPGETSTLVFTINGGRLASGGRLEVTLPDGLELLAESARVGSEPVEATVSEEKLLLELPAIGDEGLSVELKVTATPTADGPQRVAGIVTREERARSLEASTELQIHVTYDLGGCGCGASGESAAGAGLLALLGVAMLRRRRPALARVTVDRARR